LPIVFNENNCDLLLLKGAMAKGLLPQAAHGNELGGDREGASEFESGNRYDLGKSYNKKVSVQASEAGKIGRKSAGILDILMPYKPHASPLLFFHNLLP